MSGQRKVDVLKGQPAGAVAYIGGEVSQRRMLQPSEIHTSTYPDGCVRVPGRGCIPGIALARAMSPDACNYKCSNGRAFRCRVRTRLRDAPARLVQASSHY